MWITNNPEAARKLRAADRRFDKARRALAGKPLAEKVAALRELKQKRAAEYSRIMKEA